MSPKQEDTGRRMFEIEIWRRGAGTPEIHVTNHFEFKSDAGMFKLWYTEDETIDARQSEKTEIIQDEDADSIVIRRKRAV